MIRKPCKLDTDFQCSITFQRNIEVWIDGELDTVGKIESFDGDAVKIEIEKEHGYTLRNSKRENTT